MQSLTSRILSLRGPRNDLVPNRPWHFLSEYEFSPAGSEAVTSTIFLTNRECPWKCVMCDLWKNTTTESVPAGAIGEQIEFALQRLPTARYLKLYNSGSFFDTAAISPTEWPRITELIRGFESVTVENHPQLCGKQCGTFRDMYGGTLEVALGLETSHEATLLQLNKKMCLDDYIRACDSLQDQAIEIRSFIILRPPWTSEEDGVERALHSLDFAFRHGARVCSVIPCRATNGFMEQLQKRGEFHPPCISSLYNVLRESLSWNRGRVFADLWDIDDSGHPEAHSLLAGLRQMNRTQKPC